MIFPTNAVILAVAATTKVAGASHVVAAAEEKAKRHARTLLRGLISQMSMSLPNTDTQSTKMDGIIIDSNKAEEDDDHKSSVEDEPDDGVLLSLSRQHKSIINPKNSLKLKVSWFGRRRGSRCQ